jgi:hypothetical protein
MYIKPAELSNLGFERGLFSSCGATLDPFIDHRQDHDLDGACY